MLQILAGNLPNFNPGNIVTFLFAFYSLQNCMLCVLLLLQGVLKLPRCFPYTSTIHNNHRHHHCTTTQYSAEINLERHYVFVVAVVFDSY